MADYRLYLAGTLADLSSSTTIAYNYVLTDTQNPSAVKNSFSKSVVLPGSPNNDEIFGNIYLLDRLQAYGTGKVSGESFNPLKKTDFLLYVGGELYESGYFKLDSITKSGNTHSYSITLYGGLGEFIYNLTYNSNGDKLEFADLNIRKWREFHPMDLTFTADKETIYEAWQYPWMPSSKWSILNFAPCYDGLPDNIDTEKVLINTSGLTSDVVSALTGGASTADTRGWITADAPRELSEYEARDLRSYLQRPVLSVSALLESIFSPDNNGGYTVDADGNFFNTTNPYFFDAWVTLPLLSEIGKIDEEATVTAGTMTLESTGRTYDTYNIAAQIDFTEYSNIDLGIQPQFSATDTSASNLYTSMKLYGYPQSLYYFFLRQAVMIQMVAYDEIGKVVGVSDGYILGSQIPVDSGDNVSARVAINSVNKYNFTDLWDDDIPVPKWNTLDGHFVLSGGTYLWCNEAGVPQAIKFKLNSDAAFSSVKIRVANPYYYTYSAPYSGGRSNTGYGYGRLFTDSSVTDSTMYSKALVDSTYGVSGSVAYVLDSFALTKNTYEDFFSGTEISHRKILTLGVTPADFLLSYCKLFGLHIWKDPIEKIIHIQDRGVFYKEDEIVNLDNLIDRGSNISITPQTSVSKWLNFEVEQAESEAEKDYEDMYGGSYGRQRVDTGYEFDSGVTEAWQGVFKGGIQVLEKSPCFYAPVSGVPAYVYGGMKTYTYDFSAVSGYTSSEHTVPQSTAIRGVALNSAHTGYDEWSRLQFHTEDNNPSDGSLVLLFLYTNSRELNAPLWLTDDLNWMSRFGMDKPCWIMTNSEYDADGNHVAIRIDSMPYFTRDWEVLSSSYITRTWDFGVPSMVFAPDSIRAMEASLYQRCWKDYISDMYDVDARTLTCRVLAKEKPTYEWLRRFYWFDNSLWRLNKITDWNPDGKSTTLMEFLKVKDIDSYHLDEFNDSPVLKFYLPDEDGDESGDTTTYTASTYEEQSFTAYIEISDGTGWAFTDNTGYVVYSNGGGTDYLDIYDIVSGGTSGRGNSARTLIIPENSSDSGRTIYFGVEADDGNIKDVHIYQPSYAPTVIYYTSTDASAVTPYNTTGWSTNIVSNVYEGGQGAITFDGMVSGIPAYAFSGCTTLESVEIPSGVTSIGDNAFYRCTSLTGITIPDSVTIVRSRAFLGCSALTDVTIGSGVTQISNQMFRDCTSLTGITIPSGITEIRYGAFYGCTSLTSITIPDSVTSIDTYAFYRCTSLTGITIPDSVTSIDRFAFDSCISLTSITCEATTAPTIEKGTFQDIATGGTLYYPSGSDYSSWLSEDLYFLGYYCWNMDDVIIVTDGSLRYYLKTDGTSSVEANPNNKPSGNLTIPSTYTYNGNTYTVTVIRGNGFKSCTNLTSVVIPNTITAIHSSVFQNCTSLTGITIPDSVTSIDTYAFYDCTSLTGITIPSGVTSIGDYAFLSCTSLTGITIPSGVTSIGESTFRGCTSLTGITIPSGVTSIDSNAFANCSALTGITIPSGVTSIGGNVFRNCTSLTGITIPDSVTSIGGMVFQNCTSLTDVTIGSVATRILGLMFQGCTSLTSITCEATTAPRIEENTFQDIATGGTLYYPSGSDYSTWLSGDTYYLGYYGWSGSTFETPTTAYTTGNITIYPILEELNDSFILKAYADVPSAYTGYTGSVTVPNVQIAIVFYDGDSNYEWEYYYNDIEFYPTGHSGTADGESHDFVAVLKDDFSYSFSNYPASGLDTTGSDSATYNSTTVDGSVTTIATVTVALESTI